MGYCGKTNNFPKNNQYARYLGSKKHNIVTGVRNIKKMSRNSLKRAITENVTIIRKKDKKFVIRTPKNLRCNGLLLVNPACTQAL